MTIQVLSLILPLLFGGYIIWCFLIEPKTDIHEPTKRIVEIIKAGDRFTWRKLTWEEETTTIGSALCVLSDPVTGGKNIFSSWAGDPFVVGDFEWMTENERSLVYHTLSGIIREEDRVKQVFIDKATRKKREKAKETYK